MFHGSIQILTQSGMNQTKGEHIVVNGVMLPRLLDPPEGEVREW